jgi:hypothetical protein
MISKVEEYRQKQFDLNEIDNVVDISISQVNYPGTQTPSHQITIDGANPLFVSEVVKWMNNKKAQIVSDIKSASVITVNQFKTAAVVEAQLFIADPKAFTEIVETPVEIIPDPIVEIIPDPEVIDPVIETPVEQPIEPLVEEVPIVESPIIK